MTLQLYVDEHPGLPDDQELMLITDYLCRNLSSEQVEGFEERLAEDEAFFDRVSPFLDAWCAPGLTPTEIATREEMRAEGFFDRKPRRRLQVTRFHVYGGVAAAAGLAFLMLTQIGKRDPLPVRGASTKRAPQVATTPAAVQPPAPTTKAVRSSNAVPAPLPAPVQIAEAEEPGSLPPVAGELATAVPRSIATEAAAPESPAITVAVVAPHDSARVRITWTNATPTNTQEPQGFWGRVKGKIAAVFGKSETAERGAKRPSTRRNRL
jgi:hypothetical protein